MAENFSLKPLVNKAVHIEKPCSSRVSVDDRLRIQTDFVEPSPKPPNKRAHIVKSPTEPESEAMYDYARLPTLVLNQIFGYLSVKERVKAKSVCRAWREEIKLREQMSDTLVLHLGSYRLNIRWTETNNKRPMKFENSFQMKNLDILKHPLTRSLLLKKTKKLAIVDFNVDVFNSQVSSIQPYLGHFDQCEEIEIRSVRSRGTLTFNLPKLKVLVVKDSSPVKLVLNCPSLEVLFWNQGVNEIRFQNAKKLKRLLCFGWPATVWLKGKFSSLEYLNFFAAHDEPVNDRLLDRMPKLKRLVLYSNNPQADLKIIREQQKRFGLPNLEVLFNGFRDPVEVELETNECKFIIADWSVERLHANYSKLVENSPWRVCINYSQLFNKFKILPSNFFERFSEPFVIEITEVANYKHLLGFLKCYPFVEKMTINFSKVNAYRVLDLAHSLQPSLNEVTIQEERPSDLLVIDLSFLRLLKLAFLHLESTRLPVSLLRRVGAQRGPRFMGFGFKEIQSNHQMLIGFSSGVIIFCDFTCMPLPRTFPTLEQLIAYMQSDKHLSKFLL